MLTISNNNMLLRNFGYNGGTWATDLMDLNPQNLVVGKNAVGKSMTIRRIAEVADVISGRKSVEDVDVFAVYAIVLKHDENTEFILERNNSNRVINIKVNDIKMKGTTFRSLLGLRSTDFTIELKDENILITTYGYGHGVGMSQYGANGMAMAGYNYKDILNHYYKNVTIKKE